MEFQNKCTSKDHKENNAITYCPECNIFMCNKCGNFHSTLFSNHNSYKLDNNFEELFTGICKYEGHKNKLEFFCKTHNVLCCISCISKIKKEGIGQHTDCKICLIEEIKNEKKDKLKENIEKIQKLSNDVEKMINQLEKIYKTINKDKEELKFKIQTIFTKIRNVINEREDKILAEVDKEYNDIYFNDDIIIESKKLPDKIKKAIEIQNNIDEKDWNNENKLSLLINNCINFENNVKDINNIKDKINKIKSINNLKIQFFPKEKNKIDLFLEKIQNFGKIETNLNFSFFKNSDILDLEEKKLLIGWLPNIPKESVLLIDSNKDGDSINVIYEKIKNKKPTLVIIMTTDGIKFGGYTTQKWKKGTIIKDDNAFVFSLDKKKKYKIRDPEKAIYINSWWVLDQ